MICEFCNDTGSRDKLGTYLDCNACGTAATRRDLSDFVKSLGPTHPEDVALAIHQRALAMAPKQEARNPTDISQRLRDHATGGAKLATNTDNKLLLAAADEIERYYGGMLNWKKTAEKKDADWNVERMARVNDRIAARQESPFELDHRMPPKDVEVLVYWPCTDGTYQVRMDEWSDLHEDPIGMGGPTLCVGEGWVSYGDENITHWAPIATPSSQTCAAPAAANGALTDEQIDAAWDSLPGANIIQGQNSMNWNSLIRRAFARAILAAAGQDAALVDERKEFLAFAHRDDYLGTLEYGDSGHFAEHDTNVAWSAWKARAALSGAKGN